MKYSTNRLFDQPSSPACEPAMSDLCDRVRDLLSQSLYEAIRNGLLCTVGEGRSIQLHGQLPTYFLKQIAQEIVMQVPGIQVVNLIEVALRNEASPDTSFN